jgi:hypothetical protein
MCSYFMVFLSVHCVNVTAESDTGILRVQGQGEVSAGCVVRVGKMSAAGLDLCQIKALFGLDNW